MKWLFFSGTILLLYYFFVLQWLCVPFVLMNPHSTDITKTAFNFTYQAPWIGSVNKERAGMWIDNFLLLVRNAFTNLVVSAFRFRTGSPDDTQLNIERVVLFAFTRLLVTWDIRTSIRGPCQLLHQPQLGWPALSQLPSLLYSDCHPCWLVQLQHQQVQQ